MGSAFLRVLAEVILTLQCKGLITSTCPTAYKGTLFSGSNTKGRVSSLIHSDTESADNVKQTEIVGFCLEF